MGILEILFWIGVVCAVIYAVIFGVGLVIFAIITDGFSNTSKKFCSRVLGASLIICLFWPLVIFSILVLWALGELSE